MLLNVPIAVVSSRRDVSAAYVGSSTTFACSANDSARVVWHFTPASLTRVLRTVNFGSNLAPRFAGRYHMNDVDGQGAGLAIDDVQHCDAGFFRCNVVTSAGRMRTCDFVLISVGKSALSTYVS